MTSALDMPEIMSYIYSKSWKLQFSASSSIIIIEDYYLQTFLHSLDEDKKWTSRIGNIPSQNRLQNLLLLICVLVTVIYKQRAKS